MQALTGLNPTGSDYLPAQEPELFHKQADGADGRLDRSFGRQGGATWTSGLLQEDGWSRETQYIKSVLEPPPVSLQHSCIKLHVAAHLLSQFQGTIDSFQLGHKCQLKVTKTNHLHVFVQVMPLDLS